MPYLLHLITISAILIPICVGYNFVFGRGKILFFGQEAISLPMVYCTFIIVSSGGGYLLGALAGLAFAVLASIFFAWLALRLDDDAIGIMSIAMHLVLYAIVLNWTSLTRGSFGIPFIPKLSFLANPTAFLMVSVAVAALFVAFVHRLDRSSLGRSLGALAENRWHAQALGISRARSYLCAFLIAGTGSFLSSFLYPQYVGLLHPSDYTVTWMVFFLMVSIVGGSGSVLGCTLATILLTFLKEGLRFFPLPLGVLGPIRLLLFGMILILAVYVRRKELFPVARRV